MIDRRAFLRGALFVAAAPIIIKASSLMALPARSRWIPFPFYDTETVKIDYRDGLLRARLYEDGALVLTECGPAFGQMVAI